MNKLILTHEIERMISLVDNGQDDEYQLAKQALIDALKADLRDAVTSAYDDWMGKHRGWSNYDWDVESILDHYVVWLVMNLSLIHI